MNNKKKIVTFCIILGAAILSYFYGLRDREPVDSSAPPVLRKTLKKTEESKVVHSEEAKPSKPHPVSDFCRSEKPFSGSDIVHKEAFAENTHFKKNGEVYRIRVFVEDGQNTSFKKLVFFKEDEDGFPRIISTKGLINPTKEQIGELLKGGEVIHREADISIELKDGRAFNYSEVNGEIVKVLDGNSGYSCR
ncbi:MAG: hypothetical protein EP326_05220 [Deltaproteobacteria bacterium]|nr:MAG: hypothetical protein EP326_05220 [Deltaproteobacteria bacterium]